MTLRIGFSETILIDPRTRDSLDGIGVYTRELRRRFAARADISVVPVVMGARAAAAAAPGTMYLGPMPGLASAVSIVTGVSFAGAARFAQRADVYFATDYRVPRLRTPVCATVFDAIPLSHPEWANPRMRMAKNWILRMSMQWADRVLTISQAMVPEIVEQYGIAEDRITVTPLGVDESWFVPEAQGRIDAVCRRHALAPGYLLTVGTLQPRKNIPRLVEAWLRMPPRIREGRQLVVVGKSGWRAEETRELLRDHAADGVRWLERVPDTELRALYQAARGLVFPSLYEGFGLPVLEAFASRTAVVTSTGTSLPDLAGGAALLVDPLDIDAIAAAMARIVEDDALVDDLRARGYERAAAYTWDTCAARTIDVLHATADRREPEAGA